MNIKLQTLNYCFGHCSVSTESWSWPRLPSRSKNIRIYGWVGKIASISLDLAISMASGTRLYALLNLQRVMKVSPDRWWTSVKILWASELTIFSDQRKRDKKLVGNAVRCLDFRTGHDSACHSSRVRRDQGKYGQQSRSPWSNPLH